MYKNAAGIYSSIRPSKEIDKFDFLDQKKHEAGLPPVSIDCKPAGKGVIETYTIIYNRDYAPAYAIICGRTEQNIRFIANSFKNQDTFKYLESACRIGTSVHLRFDPRAEQTKADIIFS